MRKSELEAGNSSESEINTPWPYESIFELPARMSLVCVWLFVVFCLSIYSTGLVNMSEHKPNWHLLRKYEMEPEHLSEKNTAVPKETLTAVWIKSNLAGMGPRLLQGTTADTFI